MYLRFNSGMEDLMKYNKNASNSLFSERSAKNKVLIIVPHEDDETIIAGNIIDLLKLNLKEYTIIQTNEMLSSNCIYDGIFLGDDTVFINKATDEEIFPLPKPSYRQILKHRRTETT